MSRTISYTLLTLVTVLTLHTGANAQSSCGSIIQTDGDRTVERAIANCNEPFGPSRNESEVEFFVNGSLVENGDVIQIDFESPIEYELTVATNTISTFGSLYKKVDNDYIADFRTFWLSTTDEQAGGVIDGPGEYVFEVVTDFFDAPTDTPVVSQIKSLFIKTAHAFIPEPKMTIIYFTVEAVEEEEPPLSDLLLQYEPILQFHKDEDYYPMNVDAFVKDSGLWKSNLLADEELIPRGENNGLTLDYLATTTVDTSDWYVSFSGDEAGEFDLDEAERRYNQLADGGEAVPTYYAHESEHSYIDDLGNKHEFIVLQYWYFYAMNNWREQEGQGNDHEGDWESVFVFLDKNSEEPEYAAFSAHHNDGVDEFYRLDQYASVRKSWFEVQKISDSVKGYVSLGSHAKYPSAGKYFTGLATDDASGNGDLYGQNIWKKKILLTLSNDEWVNAFEGKFGANQLGLGRAGIEGPLYNKVSGTNRFLEPLKWAGIDRITDLTINEPVKDIDLPSQGITFGFAEPLPSGTSFSSVPHNEFISFGTNQSTVNLLPKYWDITLGQPNGAFSVLVSMTYSDEEVAALSFNENRLGVYFFNPETDQWEPVVSTVDTTENHVSFTTDHFSIYAIGELPEEVTFPDDETGTSTAISSNIETTDEELNNEQVTGEALLNSSQSTRTDRENSGAKQVLGVTTTIEENNRRQLMLKIIDLLNQLLTLKQKNLA